MTSNLIKNDMRLKSITLKRILNAARVLLVLPFALIGQKRYRNIWIISERPDQARDNGYVFFKYMREKHPEQQIVYLIDHKSTDYKKVAVIGDTVQFDSWKHYFFFCVSKLHISAHVGGCIPTDNPFARYMKKILKYKDVFLPHGVSYGISEFCLAKYGQIDLFICSGKPEYENVLNNYGYKKDQVAYTGFPRLDKWHDIQVKKNLILLMPTWRMYLAQNPDTVFVDTAYYRAYQTFLNSSELRDFLTDNELSLVFYLHHGMRKYVHFFHVECPNIEIVYKDDAYDIQELLKESALLITDFSSVHFDFSYMEKPVIYYQFDCDDFWANQYKQSEFDAVRDGFGPVAFNQEELLTFLKESFALNFEFQEKYLQRMKNFYIVRDKHNCDRVYIEIVRRYG